MRETSKTEGAEMTFMMETLATDIEREISVLLEGDGLPEETTIEGRRVKIFSGEGAAERAEESHTDFLAAKTALSGVHKHPTVEEVYYFVA